MAHKFSWSRIKNDEKLDNFEANFEAFAVDFDFSEEQTQGILTIISEFPNYLDNPEKLAEILTDIQSLIDSLVTNQLYQNVFKAFIISNLKQHYLNSEKVKKFLLKIYDL